MTEKMGKLRLAGVMMIWMLLLSFQVFALSANTTVFKTVENASDGCTVVAVDGRYVSDVDAVLKRINEIRQEACTQGVPDPRNRSRALTPADYVQIKWSADLEYIAMVRAAESSLVTSHVRPNGTSCFTVRSPGGMSSYGEVLAWNYSTGPVSGINQWYEEKSDWINNTPGAVTGHYTQMIDPSNTYVGIGCFLSETGIFYNTTSGEFHSGSGFDETRGASVSDCRVLLEIRKAALSAPELVVTGQDRKDKSTLDRGDVLSYALGMTSTLEGCSAYVFDAGNVKWSGNNISVANVDNKGNVRINGVGTVKITATSDSGLTAETTLSAAHKAGKAAVETKASVNTDGKRIIRCSLCNDIMEESVIPRVGEVSLAETILVYSGKAQKPEVVARDVTGASVGTKVSYKNNTDIGEGTASVSFKGDYEGSLELAFQIVPQKVDGLKGKAGKKSMQVSWKKAAIKKGGYEIQYSPKKNFAKSKTVRIKKIKTISKKIGKLKGNKKYYVRIRAFATVNGKKYFSPWSAVKKVKTAK